MLKIAARAVGLLQSLFASYREVYSAIVYVSRAIGNFRNGSDIDIILSAPGTENARSRTCAPPQTT